MTSSVGAAIAQFTVTLEEAAEEIVSVSWATVDGTAIAGEDYAQSSGTLVFAPGETSKVIEVLVYGRDVGTEDRVFYVNLEPPTNAILTDQVGACIISVDTQGSTPVLTVIIAKGERGEKGDSAYQVWRDLGNEGDEQDFIDSLRPDPEGLAEEVAPLIDASVVPVTAAGTGGLTTPDVGTVADLARRIAYMPPSVFAIAGELAAGTNLIPLSDFVGGSVDPASLTGFSIVVVRSGQHFPCEWAYSQITQSVTISNAQEGDIPVAVQVFVGGGDASAALVTVDGEVEKLSSRLATIYSFIAAVQLRNDPLGGSALLGHNGDTVKAALDYLASRVEDIPSEVDAAGTAGAAVSAHNADAGAHPGLSAFITGEANRAEQARDAAVLGSDVWPTTAAAIGQGVSSASLLDGGSGGTDGTFSLSFTGGTAVLQPAGRFVVSGGSVTQVLIDHPGYYSAGAPTIGFGASAGLTGASASPVMGQNTPTNAYFSVPSEEDDEFIVLYRADAGPVASKIVPYPSYLSVAFLLSRMLTAPDGLGFTIEDDAGRAAVTIDEDGVFSAASAYLKELETPGFLMGASSHKLSYGVSDELGAEVYGVDREGRFVTQEINVSRLNGMDVDVVTGDRLPVFAANRVGFGNEGQSNGEGRLPAVHTAPVHDCVGFAAHSESPSALLAMTAANCSTGGNREVPAFGAVDFFKQLIQSELGLSYTDHEYQTVLVNTAYSGFTIEQLSDGTDSYNEYVGQIQSAYNISQADGKSFVHLANFWTQGEGNFRDGVDGYYSQLLSYHKGRNLAAKAVTGQVEPVLTIASQVNSSGADYVQSVALAVLYASIEHDDIVLACPTYFRQYQDDVHGDGPSLDLEGAYLGLAAFLTLVLGRKFRPLYAVSSRLQGRVQEVTFNKEGLFLATSSTVPAVPQHGFQMRTPGGGDIALESAEVTGPRTVRFVWESVPPEGSVWWAGGKGISSGKGSYIGSCINLRDSQGDKYSYKSVPLHNWCVVHKMNPRGE